MAVMGYIEKIIPVPDEVTVTFDEKTGHLKVDGGGGKVLERRFLPCRIKWDVSEKEIKLSVTMAKRFEKALIGTWEAHIKNMIKGVTKGFTYTLRGVSSHFPMTLEMRGSTLHIKNFLGEKTDRTAKILPGVEVEIKKKDKVSIVTLRGIDKEKVGQSAANIELATRVKDYDVRVFGDGVFLVSKGE